MNLQCYCYFYKTSEVSISQKRASLFSILQQQQTKDLVFLEKDEVRSCQQPYFLTFSVLPTFSNFGQKVHLSHDLIFLINSSWQHCIRFHFWPSLLFLSLSPYLPWAEDFPASKHWLLLVTSWFHLRIFSTHQNFYRPLRQCHCSWPEKNIRGQRLINWPFQRLIMADNIVFSKEKCWNEEKFEIISNLENLMDQ